ncbi:MAG: hypothetical protein RBR86_09785 [Pseudobdellovibrionaceae bacterium]|jgi:hypothetical protein|nr:hypothetical protein [Pseudobdellovibrionaceae bacterium]
MPKVLTEEELGNLFQKLFEDAILAHNYFVLLTDINNSRKEYWREFAQSETFWYLVQSSIKEAMGVSLCRVYIGQDDKKNLTLYRLLNDICEYSCYFNEENFRKRLKDNQFLESLCEMNRTVSTQDIDDDKDIVCEKKNPLVKRLMLWRHHRFMHASYSVAKGNNTVLKSNPLNDSEVKELIENSIKILNKYSHLFRAETRLKDIIGKEDFLHTLKLVRLGIEKKDKEFQELVDQFN